MPTRAALLALVLVVIAADARAWGRDGHRLVGLIAERHLSATARAGVKAVLGTERISDESVASWADSLRVQARVTSPWHFVNAPLNQPLDRARDCPRENCAPGRIASSLLVLADPNAAPLARDEALRLVVHLVGDLHQPLHAGSDNDFGGNRVHVDGAGSLHVFVDETLVERLVGGRPLEEVAAKLDEDGAPDVATWTLERDPWAWAGESHELTRALYRRWGYAPPGRTRDATMLAGEGRQLVARQLLKAGLRLAAALEVAFAPRPASGNPPLPEE